jgi:hypothetical protein
VNPCTCGHAHEEHGLNDEFPNSTECSVCDPGDCIAYEDDGNQDEPDEATS